MGEPAMGRANGRGTFWGNFTYKRAKAGKSLSFLCGEPFLEGNTQDRLG